jgi:hypothetical protein
MIHSSQKVGVEEDSERTISDNPRDDVGSLVVCQDETTLASLLKEAGPRFVSKPLVKFLISLHVC